MRVCGVELKGGEAIICLLSYEVETFNIPDCRKQSFAISNSESTQSINEFYFAFKKLMEDYKVDQIAIIERHQKGKWAGSATSFKLETAIQLCGIPVELISTQDIKAQLKRNPPQVDFDGLGLKKFQQAAFDIAYTLQMQLMYARD